LPYIWPGGVAGSITSVLQFVGITTGKRAQEKNYFIIPMFIRSNVNIGFKINDEDCRLKL
jgi:hypothetical protein